MLQDLLNIPAIYDEKNKNTLQMLGQCIAAAIVFTGQDKNMS